MPKLTGLLTDWLTIGTSGPTVDGRNIKPQWLLDAEELYDPEEYTAVADAEHWLGNYGTVRELRTTTDKKKRLALQARIRPNKHYLEQNSDDKRLFFSMVLDHNFAKTGKTYLIGLATTDRPASLGTSETHFSRQDNAEVFRGGSEEFSVGALQGVEDRKTELIPAFKAALKDFFSNHKPKTPKQEDYEMTPEQVKEMLDGQKAINESLTTMLSLLTPEKEDLKKKDTETDDPKKENLKKKDTKTDDPKKEDFATLQESVTSLGKSLNTLCTKFDDAVKGKFGKDVPANEGGETEGAFL